MVFLILIIASFLLQMILPWWIIIIISFAICGIIGKTGKIAFWHPFWAILLLWIGVALFHSIPNEHILASRIAEMLKLQSWPLVLLVTGVLGGLVAGISGFCGYHFRKAMISLKTAA